MISVRKGITLLQTNSTNGGGSILVVLDCTVTGGSLKGTANQMHQILTKLVFLKRKYQHKSCHVMSLILLSLMSSLYCILVLYLIVFNVYIYI